MLRPKKLTLTILRSIIYKMNDQICWDPTLVKKFSSSNHFKLLNQLKNEVIKYPLNNKKNSTSIQTKNTYKENNDESNIGLSQSRSISSNSYIKTDNNSNKSNVSFNNSKNFSIYNQNTANNISRQNDSMLSDTTIKNQDSPSPSFKDRLSQVDMK